MALAILTPPSRVNFCRLVSTGVVGVAVAAVAGEAVALLLGIVAAMLLLYNLIDVPSSPFSVLFRLKTQQFRLHS